MRGGEEELEDVLLAVRQKTTVRHRAHATDRTTAPPPPPPRAPGLPATGRKTIQLPFPPGARPVESSKRSLAEGSGESHDREEPRGDRDRDAIARSSPSGSSSSSSHRASRIVRARSSASQHRKNERAARNRRERTRDAADAAPMPINRSGVGPSAARTSSEPIRFQQG